MASSVVEASRGSQVALGLARERLLSLQDEAGWWQGELQTNVTMDAEDMLLREFLGIRRADETERSAAWIRSQQRADGTWANFHGGPGELSTTIEAYWALRLAGDPPEAEHMATAARVIGWEGGQGRLAVAPGRGPAPVRASAPAAAAPACHLARRALDRAPPGGRRLLGRDPAALGLLADGAAPVRLPARASGDAAWRAGAGRIHGRGPRRLARRGRAAGHQPAPRSEERRVGKEG